MFLLFFNKVALKILFLKGGFYDKIDLTGDPESGNVK